MLIFDCVVIGAGPSGMTASIYLKRAGKNVVLIDKDAPGGQMNKSNIIQNYPGFINIDGASLSLKMFEQVQNLNVNYQYGEVQKIEKKNDYYDVITSDNKYSTKNVIIATGRSPLSLGIQNEDKLVGHGISYCATCDGILYKDKVVGVVGSGNTAFEEAIYLGNICKKVYVFSRSDKYRADNTLQESLKNYSNIEIINDSNVTKLIEKDNRLYKVEINNKQEFELSGLFIFIGQVPTRFIVAGLETDNNYIVVDNKMKTNLPHIYACGDIIKKDYYQISIAVGEGSIAALNVLKELKN